MHANIYIAVTLDLGNTTNKGVSVVFADFAQRHNEVQRASEKTARVVRNGITDNK